MTKPNSFFLGGKGKVLGPFSDSQISDLRASGKIAQYTYLWDEKEQAWINLDPPPPAPDVRAPIDSSAWEGICFGGDRILSGSLANVHHDGCDLVSSQASGTPELSEKVTWTLNVLDRNSRRAVNVKAKVASAYFENGRWIYRLAWESYPEL